MESVPENLTFETASKNIKRHKFATFKHLIPLISTTTLTDEIDRYDLYTFFWNLDAFQADKPTRQRSDDNSWTMFIHCLQCTQEEHPEPLFTLHLRPEKFSLLIHAWCPHQQWIIKKRDDIKGGILRLTSLDTRNQKII
jgi:hypothetical protein